MTHCPLCEGPGGRLILQARRFRVIHVEEPASRAFPAFYRLVWNTHVAEFSDLSAEDRRHCMDAVAAIEQSMRTHLSPTKMNVATLGNMVPHLHWHLIARFDWDSHFPSPVWAAAAREPQPGRLADLEARLPELEKAMCGQLALPG